MKIASAVTLSLYFVIFCILKNCLAKRAKNVYCGACLALIDEMNWEIAQVDSKKKIQVGSFRIDSKGDQDLREIPLARSAVHLTELLENVCSQMNNYAVSTNADGRLSYVRTSSRDGSPVSLTNIQITGEVHDQLKFACESLIEEHEEELIPSFQVGLGDDMSEILCSDLMSVCSKTNITDYAEATKAVRTIPVKDSDGDADEDSNDAEEEEDSAEDDKAEESDIKEEL